MKGVNLAIPTQENLLKTFKQHLYLHMRMVISTMHSTTSLSYLLPSSHCTIIALDGVYINHLSNHLAMYSNQIVTHVVIFWDTFSI